MNYHACLFTWFLCEQVWVWAHKMLDPGMDIRLSGNIILFIKQMNPCSLQNNKNDKSEVKEIGLRELRNERSSMCKVWFIVQHYWLFFLHGTKFCMLVFLSKVLQFVTRPTAFSQCACSFSLFLLLNASLPLRIFMWLYYTGRKDS